LRQCFAGERKKMKFEKRVRLKNGMELLMRNGTEADGEAAATVFNDTHRETDYLLSYPEEHEITPEEEAEFLKSKEESEREAEILAIVDGSVVGLAGIDMFSPRFKLKHRAEFGVSVSKDYWGLGIGRHLLRACMELAVQAGYEQLELDVVAENERAIGLYKSEGFVEFGRNPKGFKSKYSGDQALVLMRLELPAKESGRKQP